MKALQIIATLCITTSFSLYSMENEEYIGLQFYHPTYHKSFGNEDGAIRCGSTIYSYCTSNKKNAHNCDILNAYLLLNRRPQESVETQIKFYTKDLEDTTSKLNSTSDIFRKKDLNLRKSLLQRVIPQIQRARLSGNLQDSAIQQQVDTALKNTFSIPNQYKMFFIFNSCDPDYNRELIHLEEAVCQANDCEAVYNRDAFYNPNSYINLGRYGCNWDDRKDALCRKEENNK
jgi:hypothetical protein